jgi:hypothetical protein
MLSGQPKTRHRRACRPSVTSGWEIGCEGRSGSQFRCAFSPLLTSGGVSRHTYAPGMWASPKLALCGNPPPRRTPAIQTNYWCSDCRSPSISFPYDRPSWMLAYNQPCRYKPHQLPNRDCADRGAPEAIRRGSPFHRRAQKELQSLAAPGWVRQWIGSPPEWLQVRQPVRAGCGTDAYSH